jgi:hypothetical protein
LPYGYRCQCIDVLRRHRLHRIRDRVVRPEHRDHARCLGVPARRWWRQLLVSRRADRARAVLGHGSATRRRRCTLPRRARGRDLLDLARAYSALIFELKCAARDHAVARPRSRRNFRSLRGHRALTTRGRASESWSPTTLLNRSHRPNHAPSWHQTPSPGSKYSSGNGYLQSKYRPTHTHNHRWSRYRHRSLSR